MGRPPPSPGAGCSRRPGPVGGSSRVAEESPDPTAAAGAQAPAAATRAVAADLPTQPSSPRAWRARRRTRPDAAIAHPSRWMCVSRANRIVGRAGQDPGVLRWPWSERQRASRDHACSVVEERAPRGSGSCDGRGASATGLGVLRWSRSERQRASRDPVRCLWSWLRTWSPGLVTRRSAPRSSALSRRSSTLRPQRSPRRLGDRAVAIWRRRGTSVRIVRLLRRVAGARRT